MRSPKSMSIMEPMETKLLKPMFSCIAQSRIAEPSAPLWDMKAILPGLGILSTNVAFSFVRGRITPMQFGPPFTSSASILARSLPYFFFNSRILSSSALPFAPVSLKPAETIIAPFTPAFPHSSMTAGTVFAGVAIMAKSTVSGICSIFW